MRFFLLTLGLLLISGTAQGQRLYALTGKVRTQRGLPLCGATVRADTSYAVTDRYGEYRLTIPIGSTAPLLVVQYHGYCDERVQMPYLNLFPVVVMKTRKRFGRNGT